MAFLEMCEKAGVSSEEFSSLKRELKLMVTRRAVMTHVTAKQLGFTELVYSVITAFIERLTNSSYVQDMDVSAPVLIPRLRIALVYLEHSLNDIIKPYLGIEFRILPNGHPFTFISPSGHFNSTLRSIYTASKSLSQYSEWVHAALLDCRIEQLRAKMKNTGEISPSDMSFARQFKETLVSGNPEMLPKVTTGLFEHRQRDLARPLALKEHHPEYPPYKTCQKDTGNESLDEKDRNKSPSPEQRELTEEEKELCEQFMRLLG
ncbi:hypothetical protein B0O99DRAFT_631619 [Bisporella sp. PMI_857]|nr:hypothetical protein B0O99DRAFT_631619 [Bisporella sp. PMI_857]